MRTDVKGDEVGGGVMRTDVKGEVMRTDVNGDVMRTEVKGGVMSTDVNGGSSAKAPRDCNNTLRKGDAIIILPSSPSTRRRSRGNILACSHITGSLMVAL
jgi:hypothetical protein